MQNHTSRQLQAQKTKRKIYNAAVYLFNKHGFDNTTIEDISRKAGVSVGAFYHYYPSKSDIYTELYQKIDEFFETTVKPQLTEEDFYGNVLIYFKHYAEYQELRGIDIVKQLFNNLNELFIDKNRYMHRLLHEIIQQGEEKDQLTKDMTPDEIVEFLMVSARGIAYDWLLHKGDYSLVDKMLRYISEMRHIFVR